MSYDGIEGILTIQRSAFKLSNPLSFWLLGYYVEATFIV